MKIHSFTAAQKIFGIAALVFIVVLALNIFLYEAAMPLPSPEFVAHATTRAELPASSKLVAAPAIKGFNPQSVQLSPEKVDEPKKSNDEALAVEAPWQMADVKADAPSIPLGEEIAVYAIVELPQKSVHFPAVGEQVSLPMLRGKAVTAKVKSTLTLANGDYSWSGHLEGYGTDYPVVMTYGERAIFATITTPEGSYSMESMDGVGWLYKNPAEVELSAVGANDYLDIDAQHK